MKQPYRSYRRALVTGATSGIGAAFARVLPDDTGLLLAGRNVDVLADMARELAQPDRALDTVAADLATDTGCATVAAAAEAFGIDLLVCNAGLGPYGTFLETEESFLRDTVAVNVTAVVVLLRRLLPGMLERARAGGGRAGLIVTASEAAFLPVPYLGTYAASKAFDLSLTESLAAELRSEPIDILALCPSATKSQFGARSGYGGNFPGAQESSSVARAALAAIGRRRTLMPGPLTGRVLAGPALVRAGLAQGLALAQGSALAKRLRR